MKILFITATRVGDAVLTTGLLAWLVDRYPGARLTIACGPYGADIFRAVPGLEKIIVMKKKKANLHWVDLWRQCIGIRWDLIVDLRNSAVSRLLWASRRAIRRRGNGQHKVKDNAAVLGLTPPPDPHIWLTAQAEAEANALLPEGIPLLAFGPAANWPLKQWPIGFFVDLERRLTASGGPLANAAVLIVADRHERESLAPLLQSVPDSRRIEIIGCDLQTAAACLKRARLYVGNDSGLMHLSAALGTPTLGLFGPGFPDIYGPWGKTCAVARTPESREELLTRIPADVKPTDTLMNTLNVDAVYEAAVTLLART